MSEQLRLFEREEAPWIDRIWRTIDPKQRQAMIKILAQIASAALIDPPKTQREERTDESR